MRVDAGEARALTDSQTFAQCSPCNVAAELHSVEGDFFERGVGFAEGGF